MAGKRGVRVRVGGTGFHERRGSIGEKVIGVGVGKRERLTRGEGKGRRERASRGGRRHREEADRDRGLQGG